MKCEKDTPQQGMLYKLTSDINAPVYKTINTKYPSYHSIENDDRLNIKWYYFHEKDILLYIDEGVNLGKYNANSKLYC